MKHSSTPRTIQIIQCSIPGAWYEDLIGVTLSVIEKVNQWYFVDEYDWQLHMMVQQKVKISDTQIVER